MSNLAIIPARSGSKGLKDKNIMNLNGRPIISYSIISAKNAMIFDEIHVSTDSDNYANISIEYGAQVPFLRDDDLAGDDISSIDVLKYVVNEYKKLGLEFDTVCLLQPTSPLRIADDILKAYNEFKLKNANAVVSVCSVGNLPLLCNTLPEDRNLDQFLSKEIINKPRQAMPEYYKINGAIYILKTGYLLNTENIYENGCYAYIMPEYRSIDIDTMMDFVIAEAIMKEYQDLYIF